MRTYTRKRPDHKEIKDVHRLCRLCLSESLDTVPIFTGGSDNLCALALRIMLCVGLDIKNDEILPNKICFECCQELDKYYKFKKHCEASYLKLKSHVLAFKERQYKAELKCNEKDGDNLEYVLKFKDIELSEVTTVSLKSVASHDIEKLPDKMEEDETEDTDLNISTFLTTMLTQIGIFTSDENGLTLIDESMRSIELETGDGDLITMELVEEDEQIDIKLMDSDTGNLTVTSQVPDSPPSTGDELTENLLIIDSLQNANQFETNESGIVIKYVTSKYEPPKGHTRKKSEQTVNKKTIPPSSSSTSRGAWCEECGKRLASHGALVRHRRVHSGEKPFVCRDCGRGFAQREVMLRHRTLHSDDRPYKCSSCDKGFTQRGALLAHERAHAPPHERALSLHRCAQCPKVFLHASGLSRHMTGHNGRVYVCGACSRQFRDKSSLMRHLRNTRHAQDPTPPPPPATIE